MHGAGVAGNDVAGCVRGLDRDLSGGAGRGGGGSGDEEGSRHRRSLHQDRAFPVAERDARDRAAQRAVGLEDVVRAAEIMRRRRGVGQRAGDAVAIRQRLVQNQGVAVRALINAVRQRRRWPDRHRWRIATNCPVG